METYLDPRKCKAQQICKDFIRHNCKGMEIDAPKAAMMMVSRWGLQFDWHEFSYALDYMATRSGEAIVTQPGGYTKYLIK